MGSHQWKRDVFVSFRGTDVRYNFIAYLFHELDWAGIDYFSDTDKEDAGEEINEKLSRAIRHSRFALIVFSPNYADSKSCLNELVEILECRRQLKNHGHVAVSIFHGVSTDDVSKLTSGSDFARGFERLCKKKGDEAQIKIWKDALVEATHLSGFHLKNHAGGNESKLTETIVNFLHEKIRQTWPLFLEKNAIGVDRLADDVISLLRKGHQEDVRMIGICGAKEIGKTTVAGVACERIRGEFDCYVFLGKIGEASRSDLLGLQKKLLRDLMKAERVKKYDIHSNTQEIKKSMRRKKILLVLDDVTKKEQMEYFGAGDREYFCPGSRILITARDPSLLNYLKVDDTYTVEGLRSDDALQLFCHHAFKRSEPQQGYEELSQSLIHYAGGHPSVLKELGSRLSDKSKDQWHKLLSRLERSPRLVCTDGVRSSFSLPWQSVVPHGGQGGAAYDDGTDTGVRHITHLLKLFIDSITTNYDQEGCLVRSVKHGEHSDGETFMIELDYLNPSPYSGGKIVGFHGSCNRPPLKSIKAHSEPIPQAHPFKVFGPFGGDSGDPWDDGRHVDIQRIHVGYDESFIHSIAFDYVDDNGSIRSIRHGGSGRGETFEVKLVPAVEYITSFSGYSDTKDGLISSLTFQTNRRIWGPIGREEGLYFSLPSNAGKVIGLFGSGGDFLDSIGAYVEPYSNKLYPFKSVGLFGSSKASFWDDGNKHTNVKKIIVEFEPSKGSCIRSITFQYEGENKELLQSETHGGIDGNAFHIVRNVHTIEIDDADECLTSISGYIRSGITSLTFQTNKKTIGPIGKEIGRHFSSPATGGKVVGFYGRSGEHLEAIGAYFEPIPHLYPIKSIGPFGGLGGRAWDDRKFDGVKEIQIMHDDIIRYVMFVYDKSGEQVCSDMYGGHNGDDKAKVTTIRLDYPREYLTSISGYKRERGDDIEDAIVQSLTFYTNRRRHGPFGKERGKYFWYPSTGSKIIGFYGKYGETLNAIGVYAKPIQEPYPFRTIGSFGGSGGTPWDDGVHTDVRGFYVIASNMIHSIGIVYDNNGSAIECPQHGEEDGSAGVRVFLDYPKERLVWISGWMDRKGNTPCPTIHDLEIHTTKTTYGPYGLTEWSRNARQMLREFRIPRHSGDGRILGFFGRAGGHLNCIGARLEP